MTQTELETKLSPTEELEDKMPVIVCPHCSIGSDFRITAWAEKQTVPSIICAIGVCRLCKREVWFELSKDNWEQVQSHYPRVTERAPDELDEKVKRAFDEALKCYGAEAWNGCLLMCRRAIQEALWNLGAPAKGDLPTHLKALVDANKITLDLKDWADQARIGGRLAAHGTGGDEWGTPDKEWGNRSDAETVVEFCKSFFEYAYVMKARLHKRRGQPNK